MGIKDALAGGGRIFHAARSRSDPQSRNTLAAAVPSKIPRTQSIAPTHIQRLNLFIHQSRALTPTLMTERDGNWPIKATTEEYFIIAPLFTDFSFQRAHSICPCVCAWPAASNLKHHIFVTRHDL
jgi:hypothetical protein